MMTKKHKVFFLLASLCIIAALVNYQYLRPSQLKQPDDIIGEPEPAQAANVTIIQKEVFQVFINNSHGGNICLVGVRRVDIDAWIEFINTNNASLFNIYAIASKSKHYLESKIQVHVPKGENLKEALSNFVFDQNLYQCDLVQFGELESEDSWEAAWLASRMFAKHSTKAIWHKHYSYNKEGAFKNQLCLEEFCSGFVPQINFTNRDDVALQIQYAKHIPKQGYSINFFAYNPNRTKLEKAFKEALASAKTYRSNHPKGRKVQLMLFTSDRHFVDEEGLFDRIVGIKEEFMFQNERQWTTRVIFSSFAPAKISLFVDADSWSCLPMVPFFDFMESHEFDFTINGHWPNDMIIPDCGVYAWKWNERTRLLMAQWFDEFGSQMNGDDQGRLYRAMQKVMTKVTIGRTRPTHALRFAPGEGEDWGPKRRHQQTQILHGPVHLIHARETNEGACEVLNRVSDRKRVLVCRSNFNFDDKLSEEEKGEQLLECLKPVFNQTECNAELDNKCFKHNDWNADPDIIVRAPDFYVPPNEPTPIEKKKDDKAK